jgi:hypothetical protein
MLKHKFWILLCILIFTSTTQAQTNCPIIVQTALRNLEQICSGTGRNQACYANNAIVSEGRTAGYDFDTIGQIVNVMDMQTLVTSPLDVENNLWGVSLMRLQANLPNTLPGQNVSMLVFGDTELIHGVQTVPSVSAIVTTTANLRSEPMEADNIVLVLEAGTQVTANGISLDEQWIRVRKETGIAGWISRSLLQGDFSLLEPVTNTASEPMQAFILTAGIGVSNCQEVPQQGILIQTPAGMGMMQFRINNIDIRLGSGMYVTTQNNNGVSELNMYLLNGNAQISAKGQTRTMQAGQVSVATLNNEGMVEFAPSEPIEYDFDDVDELIIFSDILGDDFTIADGVLFPVATEEALIPVATSNFPLPVTTEEALATPDDHGGGNSGQGGSGDDGDDDDDDDDGDG